MELLIGALLLVNFFIDYDQDLRYNTLKKDFELLESYTIETTQLNNELILKTYILLNDKSKL